MSHDTSSWILLNNRESFPLLGLGLFKMPDNKDTAELILKALEHNYRLLDTASVYGNESAVGDAIKKSGLKRDEIFITTKLWNEDHGYAEAKRALELSLKRLALDYVDLYLIHWPVPGKRRETWAAIEDMYDEGLCKSIGVSNYLKPHLVELFTYCRIKPAVNQIELSPFNYLSREETVQFCRKNDIHIQSYSPLTKGLRLTDPRLNRIADSYYRSPAQILLRWAIQEGIAVIPKSSRFEHIIENSRIFDFSLSEKDMQLLSSMNENLATGWNPEDIP
jgi:diketogulonate reductase-like aldo/keto reductase